MEKRWSYSTSNGASWTVFEPVNGAKLKIREKAADIEKGRIFKRKEISSSVTIGGADYTALSQIERRGSQRCDEILMRVEYKCGFAWSEAWRGKFSPGSGEWDLDNCLVDFKPETVDRYTCILENIEAKKNILEVDGSLTFMYGGPGLEFAACVDPCSAPAGTGWTLLDTFPWLTDLINVYVRKRRRVLCVSGSPVAPSGGGWTLLSDDCATDGTATFVNSLTVGEINDINISLPPTPLVQGTCNGLTPVQPAQGPTFYYRILILDCTDPDYPSMWLQLGTIPISSFGEGTTRTGRTAQNVANFLLAQAGCGDVTVRSDFFEWDPVGNAPGYSPGINYVTGTTNQHDQICILQKSDAINTAASNPATRGEMSLSDLLETFCTMHQTFWDIDNDGNLRIEHWHYWTFTQGLDLTTTSQTIEPLKYKHLSDEIPRYERVKFMEAKGEDFVGLDIVYSGPCAGRKTNTDVKEYSPGKVTTDVQLIIDEPSTVARDGFVFIATTFDGVGYSTIIDTGAISGDYVINAPLSLANLQRDFWTWNRQLPDGNMNGSDVTFDGFLPNIEQPKVRLTMCCELLSFDSKKTVKTELATVLGIGNASIQEVEYDLFNDRVEFTLRYSY